MSARVHTLLEELWWGLVLLLIVVSLTVCTVKLGTHDSPLEPDPYLRCIAQHSGTDCGRLAPTPTPAVAR